jgi:DNA repair exonuclease SbcCD ATPase subunit
MRLQFDDFIKVNCQSAVNSRTSRKLSTQEINQYLGMLHRKDEEVKLVRLENIRLKNKIQKLATQIKEKEHLAGGLHMIDFEQLKINNVDLGEKIEERNEEIAKIENKITTNVQALAHLKEKLHCIHLETMNSRSELNEIDERVSKKRNVLTKLKQTKDKIRNENTLLKQKGGLLGHNTLLKDLENKLDHGENLKSQLHEVQQKHSELILQCNTMRQKINQTKVVQNIPR